MIWSNCLSKIFIQQIYFKCYSVHRFFTISVTGKFAVGNFTVGNFTVGNFALRIFCRTEISPYKEVRRLEVSPHRIFVVCIFWLRLIRCLYCFSTNTNIKYLYINILFTNCFIRFFHRLLNLKIYTLLAELILQSRNELKQTRTVNIQVQICALLYVYRSAFSSYVCAFVMCSLWQYFFIADPLYIYFCFMNHKITFVT